MRDFALDSDGETASPVRSSGNTQNVFDHDPPRVSHLRAAVGARLAQQVSRLAENSGQSSLQRASPAGRASPSLKSEDVQREVELSFQRAKQHAAPEVHLPGVSRDPQTLLTARKPLPGDAVPYSRVTSKISSERSVYAPMNAPYASSGAQRPAMAVSPNRNTSSTTRTIPPIHPRDQDGIRRALERTGGHGTSAAPVGASAHASTAGRSDAPSYRPSSIGSRAHQSVANASVRPLADAKEAMPIKGGAAPSSRSPYSYGMETPAPSVPNPRSAHTSPASRPITGSTQPASNLQTTMEPPVRSVQKATNTAVPAAYHTDAESRMHENRDADAFASAKFADTGSLSARDSSDAAQSLSATSKPSSFAQRLAAPAAANFSPDAHRDHVPLSTASQRAISTGNGSNAAFGYQSSTASSPRAYTRPGTSVPFNRPISSSGALTSSFDAQACDQLLLRNDCHISAPGSDRTRAYTLQKDSRSAVPPTPGTLLRGLDSAGPAGDILREFAGDRYSHAESVKASALARTLLGQSERAPAQAPTPQPRDGAFSRIGLSDSAAKHAAPVMQPVIPRTEDLRKRLIESQEAYRQSIVKLLSTAGNGALMPHHDARAAVRNGAQLCDEVAREVQHTLDAIDEPTFNLRGAASTALRRAAIGICAVLMVLVFDALLHVALSRHAAGPSPLRVGQALEAFAAWLAPGPQILGPLI